MIVLLARPVRDRRPTAMQWQLVEYDPATRLPVANLASQWFPASGTAPEAAGAVTARVREWVGRMLGEHVQVDQPATDLAGPGAWHVRPREAAGGSSR